MPPWRSSSGGRRLHRCLTCTIPTTTSLVGRQVAWLTITTTKEAQAAKWREVNKKLSQMEPTTKVGPPKVLASLDPTQGIRVPGREKDGAGRVAFADANAAFELRFGDHVCVVGSNAAGKSCWWKALSGRKSLATVDGRNDDDDSLAQQNKSFMFMSFSMHGHFLEQHRDRVVADVLGGSNDPLARRLIVQLGLYPLWYKRVGALSTGEIRKVLLAFVLSKSPKVLVLDKPFDGLDAPSRQSLKGVLSQLCQGFPRLLVDLGLSRRSIDRTSLVLLTHRAEEIPDEVTRLVAVKDLAIELEGPMKEHHAEVRQRLTHTFPYSMPLIKLPKQFRPQVPRAETLRNERTKDNLQTMLEFSNVRLQKEDHVLLDEIDWKVKQGQVWALKGLNGAGKSTLTRLILEAWHTQQLAKKKKQGEGKELTHHHHHHPPPYQGRVVVGVPRLGIVSTETHLHLAATCRTWPTSAVILSGLDPLLVPSSSASSADHPPSLHQTPPRLLPLLAEWAGILGLSEAVLAKPFGRLSQGQQKLAVIARALIAAPNLLIFDEAGQGLDSHNRTLVLSVLTTIVKTASSWLSVLYITHHEDEALPPDVTTHVLELEKGRMLFAGHQKSHAAWWQDKEKKKEEQGGWPGRRPPPGGD